MMRIVCVALASWCVVAGCSDDEGTGETGPIRIALLGPLTGPSEATGDEFQNTVNMILDEIDSTVAGRPLEIVLVDSESDADKAIAAYRAAMTDEAKPITAGFYNWHSHVALAVMDVAAELNVPHLFALGATEEINTKTEADPDKYSWTKGWPVGVKLSQNYVTALEDAIASGALDITERRVAVYGEDTAWGRSFGGGIKDQLTSAQWEVVSEKYMDAEGTDFTADIAEIRGTNPTLIAGTFASGTILTFIAQTRTAFDGADPQPLILADGLGWQADWYATLGDDSDGVVDQIPQFATQEARDFAQAYTNKYGSSPSPSASGLIHDYFRFLLKVLETAKNDYGSITRANVQRVHDEQVSKGLLTFTRAEGALLMNEYKYTDDTWPDPVIGGDFYTFPVLQYNSGNSEVVWPESIASGNNLEL